MELSVWRASCLQVVLTFALVDAYATNFHNPEFADDGLSFQRLGQRLHRAHQTAVAGAPGQPDNGDTAAVLRRETKWIGKVQIEADETTFLCAADFEHNSVCCARHPLSRDGRYVVTGRSQNINATLAEVLVQLELHAEAAMGIST
jgi:hypothetical protein